MHEAPFAVDPSVASEASSPAPSPPQARRGRAVLEVALVVLLVLGVRWYQRRDLPSGDVPAVTLTSLDGTPLEIGPRPHGYVVHFFATWCGVCRAEEGNVVSLAGDHELIAIATQSGDPETVHRYVTDAGLDPAHVALDPEGVLAHRFGVQAFPTTFYVGSDGVIRTAEVGYTTELGMRLRAWWAE